MKRFEKTSAFRYMHKDHDDKVFFLEKVNENSCTFAHTPLFDAKLQIDAPFADCKNWKKTKKEIPQLAPPAIVASKTAAKTGQLEGDYLKAFVQTLVMEAYFDNSPCQALQYSVSPAGVYTFAKLKKQELLLYPLGTVQVVKLEDVSKIKNIHLQLHGHHFQLSPPKALSKFSDDGTGHLVPWFWVHRGKFGSNFSSTEKESQEKLGQSLAPDNFGYGSKKRCCPLCFYLGCCCLMLT